MKTYIFIYFLEEDIEKVRKSLGQHVKYWKNQEFDYYKNGPFTDKSGGLIIFSSDSHEKAEEIISKDPLLKEKAIKQYWLKEWLS